MKQINIKGIAPQILQSAETSFSVNGVYGKVKVTLNNLGEYNVFTPYSLTEASAKRNPSYKVAVSEVTSKMLKSFDAAVKNYTEISKKIVSVVPEKRYKDRLDSLTPQRYVRKVFDICKPILEDAERLTQSEQKSRISCGLTEKNGKTAPEILKLMENRWDELYAYFNDVESVIEDKANRTYKAQYDSEKKQIEDYIFGPELYVITKVEELASTISSPEDFQMKCDYNNALGLLNIDVQFAHDHLINLPSETASLYSTGKLSVKTKAKKDTDLEHSLFYSGLGFYLSSLCFNISANIQRIRISVTRANEGLYWVEFNRTNFSKIRAYSLNPLNDILNFPNITKINAAGNLVGIPYSKFISLVQAQSATLDVSYAEGSDVSFTISIEDAKLICQHISDSSDLFETIKKVEALGGKAIIVNKRYENILKEIKSNY